MGNNKSVASFRSGNKEIWDWRNLPMKNRIKIALALIFYGIVDIEWKKANNIYLKLGDKKNG